MTRVTAVIPCYNGERYLAKAIASVRAQTRPVDEVLVVDDRSTDRSSDIAREAGARVVVLEKNSGPSEARNAGLRMADGNLVAFLDADDEWTPAHCEIVVGLLERWPEAVLGFGRASYHDFPQVVTAATLPAGTPANAFELMLRENLVTQSAVIVRRDLALDVGGYNTAMRHSEDYDLWLRLAVLGPFVCTHDVTCWRALHEAQASRNLLAMRRGAWTARARALEPLRIAADDTRLRRAWRATVAGWISELRESWYEDSPIGLDAMLAIGHEYGLPAGTYWAWKFRRNLLWLPRHVVRQLWRRARRRPTPSQLAVG